MAAHQSARYCACGCGASIDNLRRDAKYLPACRVIVDRRKKAESDARRALKPRVRNRTPYKAREVALRASVRPHQNIVISNYKRGMAQPARGKVMCKLCFGLPWARRADRFPEFGVGGGFDRLPISDATGRCRGCGEPYGEEPPPERGSALRSSAGMACREGELQGYKREDGQNVRTILRRKVPR